MAKSLEDSNAPSSPSRWSSIPVWPDYTDSDCDQNDVPQGSHSYSHSAAPPSIPIWPDYTDSDSGPETNGGLESSAVAPHLNPIPVWSDYTDSDSGKGDSPGRAGACVNPIAPWLSSVQVWPDYTDSESGLTGNLLQLDAPMLKARSKARMMKTTSPILHHGSTGPPTPPPLDGSPSQQSTTASQLIAPHLADPAHWQPAYQALETLKPETIIERSLLDFYLCFESSQSRQSSSASKQFYYLDTAGVQKLNGDPTHDSALVQHCLHIDFEEISRAPIMFLITSENTGYFLALFDYVKQKALILGRRSNRGRDFDPVHAEWESWDGPGFWEKIRNAFNWHDSEGSRTRVTVYETDWIPRNSHSGAGIAAFAQLLGEGTWGWDRVPCNGALPELTCDHRAREGIFYAVLHASYTCFKLWKSRYRREPHWRRPSDAVIEEMEIQPTRFQRVKNLSLIFESQTSRCRRCLAAAGPLSQEEIDAAFLKAGKGRAFTPPPRSRTPYLPNPLPCGENPEEVLAPEPPEDTESLGDFDDYQTAPIPAANAPPLTGTWTFDASGLLKLPNYSSTWKDRGFRLPPGFAKVSQKVQASDYVTRLLPTMEDMIYGPSVDSVAAEASPTRRTIGSSTTTTSDDTEDSEERKKRKPIPMGLQQMLDEAGSDPGTKEGSAVFIRGKTRVDDFIELDVEQDHIPLIREQISISIDIDSILWVTTDKGLTSKGAINLRLQPHIQDQPPFSANPAVYVNLMHPPGGDEEQRYPRLRRQFQLPLSSIPHLPFGYFGEASQQFNVYIFFPRMIHKNNNNNRAIMILPCDLQELWLSEVIFKALATAMGRYPGTLEYLPHSAEQLRWKSGDRSRHRTVALIPDALQFLLASIREEVSQNKDLLSRFGSFFFVLDSRGIKLLTKQRAPEENAFDALRRTVPGLDWDCMLDRTKGELYLDLGVSFHPTYPAVPVVGLWRVGSLRSSYALMGNSSRNSKEYRHNTMLDYGGFKAETSSQIRHHTHVAKRISYNLLFEAVRQPGEQAYVASLDDMIRCNQRYMDGYQRWLKLLDAAKDHSYGVRDELRASAFVVIKLLEVATQRAERFLQSQPITWVPAKTLFSFALRRLVELQQVHKSIALKRPENYGTVTAIILHLMRSIMVTPSRIPSYVQSALNMLHQKAVVQRFRMLFIDDLDPDDMERIDTNIGSKDGPQILQEHRAALVQMCPTKNPQARKVGPDLELVNPAPQEVYPWGETVTWETLRRLCKNHSVDFMRPVDFREIKVGPTCPQVIEDLFVAFTREAWLSLQEAFLPAGLRPEPADLREAMKVWTCQNVTALLSLRCTFLPGSHPLGGGAERKRLQGSFKELRGVFFPQLGTNMKANSIWASYAKGNGYVKKYWEILEGQKGDNNVVNALHEGLDEIFQQLQCLPKADSSLLWRATEGAVCFLTNPSYYRIKSIGRPSHETKIGAHRPQISHAELQNRLDPHNTSNRKRKRYQKQARSGKTKNKRNPPQKRHRLEESLPTSKDTAKGVPRSTRRVSRGRIARIIEEKESNTSDSSSSSSSPDTYSTSSSHSISWDS